MSAAPPRRPRNGQLWFDEAEAHRVVDFFQRVLVHTEGIYAGKPFILTPWQREEIVRPLFGWQRWDAQFKLWVRRYSEAFIFLPRGNGKSELAAALELLGLCADGEAGGENYGAAEDREQAGIVYRVAAQMVRLSPVLRKRLKVIDSRKRIVDPLTNSFYAALPRDELGTGAQGFKPHFWVVDEEHVQKKPDLIQALRKGMGKRVQPLGIVITTAGDSMTTPAGQDYLYAKKVVSGEVTDPSLFVFIREADEDADPWAEETWYAANPALGDFLSIDTLRREAKRAQERPVDEIDFLRYRLNLWRQQKAARWISDRAWNIQGNIQSVVPEQLETRECYGGLHATSVTDLASVCWAFPDDERYLLLWRFFIPADSMVDLDLRTGRRASVWARDGFLQVTAGNTIDYDAIEAQIREDADRFTARSLEFYRQNMGHVVRNMEEDFGSEWAVRAPMGAQLSPTTKEFEALVLSGRLVHGGNPIAAWMIDNAVTKKDTEGNIRLDHSSSGDNVFGLAAAIYALDRALVPVARSAYEEHGLEVI